MGAAMTVKKTLTVIVEASNLGVIEEMVESLARSACDVSNSTEDEKAHVTVLERRRDSRDLRARRRSRVLARAAK